MYSAMCCCAATMLLFIPSQVHGADGCNFYFITQPPEEIPCNPYSSSSGLMLECNIVGPDPDVPQPFDRVQWFRILDANNSGNEVELLRSEIPTDIRISTARIVAVSSMSSNVGFRSVLSIRRLNDMSAGTYWCQVQVEQNTVPSTRTRLLPEANYSDLPPCAANTIYLDLTDPVQCIDNPMSVTTASTNMDLSSTQQTSSTNHSLTVALYSSELHTLLPACSPSTEIPADNVTSLGLSDSEIILSIAIGVPTFIAFIILLLAVVFACRKKAISRHKSVTTMQPQSSSTTLVTQVSGDGVSEAVVSAGLNHRPQAQNFTLPSHMSVASQPSANTEYSEILASNGRKATTVIGKLKDACQQDSSRMDTEPATQQLYTGLNPGSMDPMLEYDATMAQVGRQRVVHNGKEYLIVDRNIPLFGASGGEYTQPQSTTLSSHHTRANLVPTQSDGGYMYVVPANLGIQNGNLHYQGLTTDTQEYVALYMTPDMQKPTPGMLDVNGHQYQLPDATSMDSPGVYAQPES